MSMKEIVSEIKLFGDPILRKKAKPVLQAGEEEKQILSKMAQMMYDSGGVGLAANQAGVDKSMIVVDAGEGLYKLINPRIIKKEGAQISEEGCLSVPGACIKIKRAKRVEVTALDTAGNPVTIKADDLMSCVLQHEIDHLNGKLILDYASFFQRLKIKTAITKKQGSLKDEGLSEPKTKSCKLQL